MENTQKKGLLTRIQDYLDSPKGRILLNYLYSWGAAIVILGALFKLTHIKGANLMLFIGMGTEVLVFFISGFEKPYIPGQEDSEDDDVVRGGGHGSIIINGNLGGGTLNLSAQPAAGGANTVQADAQPAAAQPAAAAAQVPAQPTAAAATAAVQPAVAASSDQNIDLQSYNERIAQLAASLEQISGHAQRMEQSSEELEQLTRNLISINTFYEMHLKSASQQMQNLESASSETRHMVEQIEELNRVYDRMIQAMKVNQPMGNN